MPKAAFYFLCMITFDGIHSERFVAESEELCYISGAKYVYVQTYNVKKQFDLERLWSICTDKCEHVRLPYGSSSSRSIKRYP